MLQSAIVLTGVAVRFSMQTNIVFDIDNNRYKKQYAISRITFGRWKDFKSLDYISVFKYKAYEYQVSLWYDRNQHWKIVSYEDKKAKVTKAKAPKKTAKEVIDFVRNVRKTFNKNGSIHPNTLNSLSRITAGVNSGRYGYMNKTSPKVPADYAR